MKIYVVSGDCGEYSDFTQWLVKAFVAERDARNFVEKASAISRELYMNEKTPRYRWQHPMDPGFQADYTGTNYTYTSIELEGI